MDPAVIFNLENSMQTEYFRLTEHFTKKYGANTILFMQVGAFFEMYATKSPETGKIARSRIEDISIVCGGLAITDKKQMHGKDIVVMAGFRDYNIDRYVQNVVDANFTVVVYTQKELAPGKLTRELTGVYSPGTFLAADTDVANKMTNHILCIWIDQFASSILSSKVANNKKTICGAAVVDIFTGESSLFECETANSVSSPSALDTVERFVSVRAPSETIFVTPFDEAESRRILQYIGVQSRVVHLVPNGQQGSEEIVDRCRQQKYIQHILSSFFQEDTYDLCDEFRNYVVGTQAYCYLLNFIQERNPNLVRKIALPLFDNQSTNMVLANHTLRQLNIIDDGQEEANISANSQLRSVASFLNKCCSAIGKRRFYQQITRPTFDVEWLTREYAAINLLLENYHMVDAFRKICREVADLEKICRQLVSRKLRPDSVFRLYHSILAIQQIRICLHESPELLEYFVVNSENVEKIDSWIENVERTISENLVIEKCGGCQSVVNFEEILVRPGVNVELDALVARMQENEDLFQEIRRTFNAIFLKIEGGKSSLSTSEFVRVHETEKSGVFLHLTKKRSSTLKQHLNDLLKRDPNAKIDLALGKTTVKISISEIRLTSAGSSSDAVEFPMLDRIIREKLTIKDAINQASVKYYNEFVERLETECLSYIERLIEFVARVDVLQAKAYAARTYGYCCPTIDRAEGRSFVNAKGLRHVLIEHIQTQELYVANDVCLSKAEGRPFNAEGRPFNAEGRPFNAEGRPFNADGRPFNAECRLGKLECDETVPTGILLYGTNAVGKTSLIRALGIATIMAQSGMYVPCASFTYRPYRAIFSRILGNDNLFKNLSMFAVEMSELRVILNAADQYSLVLGDELCSGTETESALSIFASGLVDLSNKDATFLFATHFHEILKFDEIRALSRIAVKHMAVHYDREQDCLVYDRVLRDGPGNRLYGLEVAKSMHLPEDFVDRAYQFRNKYFPDMRGDLAASPSRYNTKKIRAMCEMCRTEWAEETHHLQERHLADDRGRIGSIDMNHPANLMSLCERCHKGMHYGDDESGSVSSVSIASSFSLATSNGVSKKPKIIRKKTTRGYKLEAESV